MKRFVFFAGILLIAVIAFSCKQKNGAMAFLNPDDIYCVTDTLRGEILPGVVESDKGVNPLIYTNKGLICRTAISGKMLQLKDTLSGETMSATGNIGRGPGEFLFMLEGNYRADSGVFYAADLHKEIITSFHVTQDSIIQGESFASVLRSKILSFKAVDDSVFGAITLIPYQGVYLFTKEGILDSASFRIIDDKKISYNTFYFSGFTGVTPDGRKLVTFADQFNDLRIYDISKKKLTLYKERMFIKPYYKIANGKISTEPQHFFTCAGGNIALTNDRIYLLSNPRTKADIGREIQTKKAPTYSYLLAFDMECNLVKCYVFDRYFATYAISPSTGTLYAVVIDGDDLKIAKYILR